MSKNWGLWQKIVSSDDPNKEKLPGSYQDRLDSFDRLVVMKIFRPEKLMFGFSNYVEEKIGHFYLEIPTIVMEEIYGNSDVKTPIIFVLSAGADPTSLVYNFAKERDYFNNLQSISLGQGQGVVAEKLINEGR